MTDTFEFDLNLILTQVAIDHMALEMAVRAIQKNPNHVTVVRMAVGAVYREVTRCLAHSCQ